MKVEAAKPGSSSASSYLQQNGSRFLESIASLSPSQLDQALIKMLNINTEATGIRAICEGKSIYLSFVLFV